MGYVILLLIVLKYIIAIITILAIIVSPFFPFPTWKRYMVAFIAANLLLWIQSIIFFEADIISYSFLKEFYINAIIAIPALGVYLIKYLRQTQ